MATIGKKDLPINDEIEIEYSLSQLKLNQIGIVKRINAGIRATQRLSGMGITPGTEVKVLSQAPFQGPIQIGFRNTRLAIGQGLSRKIIVTLKID